MQMPHKNDTVKIYPVLFKTHSKVQKDDFQV